MASDVPSGLKFYPAYCHKASPTYFAWVKLSCATVHALRTRKGFEGQNLYFYLNHPVQFVCLVGVIVAFDTFNEKRWLMTLEDGSGATIEVVYPKPWIQHADKGTATLGPDVEQTRQKEDEDDTLDMTAIDIGTVVKAKGTLDTFWGTRQLKLERIAVLVDTAAEVRCWVQQTALFNDVLSKAWVVSADEQSELLREAEGTKEKDKGRCRRRQERQRRLQQREVKDAEKLLRLWHKEEKEREREAKACQQESAQAGRGKA